MTCTECGGTGEVLDAPGDVLGGRTYMRPCDVCDGSGVIHGDEAATGATDGDA